MEDKTRPAVDAPAPATDHDPEESSDQVQAAAGEQGNAGVAEEGVESQVGVTTEAPVDSVALEEATENPSPDPKAVTEATIGPSLESGSAIGASTAESADAKGEEGITPRPGPMKSASAEALLMSTEGTTEESKELETLETPDPIATAAVGREAGNHNITMEDVLKASDEHLTSKPVHRGMITTGEIIMLSQEGIVVDVSSKIEGILPYNQLFEYESSAEDAAKYFRPGDKIQVFVIRADIPNNTIVLSKRRADQERAWNLLQEIYDKQKPVEVEIVEKVKGGLVANLGIRAFLPASQVDIRRVNDLSPYVDKRLRVKIIELNRKRNRIIISRRSILEEEIAEIKAETLKKLEPGLRLNGEVVEITDFGVFVNLGGIDGLVHRSELSHGRFGHPREVVSIGDKVKVEVLDLDLERERINLSMKRLAPDPWENVLSRYVIGEKVEGKVTNLTQFGAFVEIEPGLEGLIHITEMSWTKRVRHPKEVLNEGDMVEVMILKIDTTQQRISLGLRQTQPDPWSSLPDRFPPGTEITGRITGITDFGVFMEIEEGIEGLVHISELAHEHIENISEHFNRGEDITAVILNIDPVEQRASLSRKRLLPYAASEFGDSVPGEGAAPQSLGGGRRGRRGRRGSDIDYDYSYAAADSGTKTTTKLGDVYADLFAQFGLTEGTGVEEAVTETPKIAVKPAAETVEAIVEPEPEIEPENVIDAVEAAALLTAAFREGKRPPRLAETEVEASTGALAGQAGKATETEVGETGMSSSEADPESNCPAS